MLVAIITIPTTLFNVFADTLNTALKNYTQPVENRDFNIKISEFDGEQVILGAICFAKANFLKENKNGNLG